MIRFPAPALHPASVVLTPWAAESLGMFLKGMGTAGTISTAYPAANLALYVPFIVSGTLNVQSVFWANGSVAGGNCDVGIYQEDGTKVVSLGSTARGSASSIVTTTSLTDTIIGRGRYYMAFLCDGTSNMIAGAPAAGLCEAAGVLEQAVGAANLPSPATFAVTTRAYIPAFGIYAQTLAL